GRMDRAGAATIGPDRRDPVQRSAAQGNCLGAAQLPNRVLCGRQRGAVPGNPMTDTPPTAQPGSEISPERPVLALGAGPAGLTAGYLLAKQGKPVIVLESTNQVGGIARTDVREGYRFDLGGHRFFTK